jgi:hypothetical protein
MGILRTDKISGLETPTAVTGSVYFDGVSNDSLQIANNTDFNFPGDFTIECWTYSITALDSYNVEFAHIAGKGNGIAASTYALGFYQSKINFTTSNSGGTYTVRQGASTLTNNTWYHFAVTRQSNTLRIFVNGKEDYSATVSDDLTNTKSFNIGDRESGDPSANYPLNGYISNLRILKGTALYTSDFTVPIHELEVIGDTVLLCCNNSDSAGADGTGKTITVNGDAAASTVSPGLTRDFTSGTEFRGVTTFDTQGYFVPPSGTTTDRNRTGGRLLWGGGHNPSPGKTTAIGYVTISSLGNSRDFGDLTLARRQLTGASSSTRGVFIGGDSSPTDAADDLMDYVTIASTGNAVFFGNLQAPGKQTPQGCSNGIRGISYGGGEPHTDQIDVFTIASLGNATDFGNADVAGRGGAATESSTRALLAGGVGPADLNRIEYITMATNGDGQDFGDLADGRRNIAGTSDGVRAVFAGGFTSPGGPSLNTLDYVTIATFGNSQDFGDLTVNRSNPGNGSSSNKIRGLFVGGNDSPAGSVSNSIDYITIATTGNAKDFGDAGSKGELTQTGLLTDSHGGIS